MPRLESAHPPRDILGTAFLVMIVLAPLPLGSNRPLWWSLLALAACVCLVAFAGLVLARRRQLSFSLNGMLAIILPATFALMWGLFQSCTDVPSVLHNPIWATASYALGRPIAGAVSLDPHESITGVMRLTTYFAVFLLALQLGRERRFADRFLRWFVIAGVAYALYGLADHILGFDRILWLKRWAYHGFLTSTFVNRNSYATFAALGLLCAAALLLNTARDMFRGSRPRRLQLLALIETLTGPATLPLAASLILGIALLQTGSRAGTFSAFAGLVVMLIAAARAGLLRSRQALVVIALLVGSGVLFIAITGTAVVDRLDSATMESDKSARAELYAMTERAIADQPVLGTGLGTFPEVFSIYRPQSFDPFVLPSKAHNSYLSNALELGIPATLLLLLALALVGAIAFQGLRRRRRGQMFPVLGLSAMVTVALHSLVDFSLEIPAVAVAYAAIAGVCCAQSFRSRNKKKRSA